MFFTPQPDEAAWARDAAGSDEHVLALVVWLKRFGRLKYLPALNAVPAAMVDHVHRDLVRRRAGGGPGSPQRAEGGR